MTKLQLYNAALIEQNKMEAPTLLIEEFNYLFNKAVLQYINLNYARYEVNQQSSDDLRWLQRTAKIEVWEDEGGIVKPGEETRWVCYLPGMGPEDTSEDKYLHILGCTVKFKLPDELKPKCDPSASSDVFSLCRRLTSDQLPAIIQNAYLKPTYKNPYFFLQPNEKKLEIICGKNKGIEPQCVYMDYLKQPEEIKITWNDVQSETDASGDCEFPDAVAYEIINIFMKLILENASDPRLQTHFAINQTIGNVPTSGEKK